MPSPGDWCCSPRMPSLSGLCHPQGCPTPHQDLYLGMGPCTGGFPLAAGRGRVGGTFEGGPGVVELGGGHPQGRQTLGIG